MHTSIQARRLSAEVPDALRIARDIMANLNGIDRSMRRDQAAAFVRGPTGIMQMDHKAVECAKPRAIIGDYDFTEWRELRPATCGAMPHQGKRSD